METMMSPTQYLDDVLEGHESDEDLCTDDEAEEEISKELAVIYWLQTFPQVSSVGGDVQTLMKEWYENKNVLRYVLFNLLSFHLNAL